MKNRLMMILAGVTISLFAFSCAQDQRASISGYSGTGEKSSTGTGPGIGTETSTGVGVGLGEGLEDEDTNSQFNTSNTDRQVDTGILPTEDTNSTYGTRDQSNTGSAVGAYPSPRPHRIPRTAE